MRKVLDRMSDTKDLMVEKFKNRKGFTLIELIVVMAIIGILVLLAAPRFLGYTKDANVSAMQTDTKVLSDAALQFNVENDQSWPVAVASVSQTATLSDGTTPVVGFAMDETLLDSYIKGTANDVTEYLLVTEGVHEGEVLHVIGVEDREGNVNHGTVEAWEIDSGAATVDGVAVPTL